MKNDNKITPFESVISQYDALLVDIWGVIYDGQDPYEGAIEAIKRIADDKPIIFLSNTPRPAEIPRKKFTEWGVDTEKIKIYTSGDAVREQLKLWDDSVFSKLGKKLYHLGEEINKDILSELNVISVQEIEEANFVLLTIYMDEGEDLNQYNNILKKAKDLNLPVICANPDIEVSHGDKRRYCAGTFAKKYEDLGGIVHYYGKPDNKVFYKSLELFSTIGIYDKSKILMIGDTMETDIKGACSVGLDSLLVLTGNGAPISKNMTLLNNYSFKPTWIASGFYY